MRINWKQFLPRWIFSSASAGALILGSTGAAQTFTKIYDFDGSASHGGGPGGALLVTSLGAVIGGTELGGPTGGGLLYSLTPPAVTGSPWAFTGLLNTVYAVSEGVIPEGRVLFGQSYVGNPIVGGGGGGSITEISSSTFAAGTFTQTLL